MAVFEHIDQFVQDLAEGSHIFKTLGGGGHQFRIALSNVQPLVTDALLSNITEINYANLAVGDRDVTINAATGQNPGGNFIVIFDDIVLTAVGGGAAAFQYVVHYNDTQATPLKPTIQWYDHGSIVNLAENETFTIDYNPTLGFFSLQGS